MLAYVRDIRLSRINKLRRYILDKYLTKRPNLMDDLALKYFRALVLSHTTHTGEIGIQLKIKRWGSGRPSEARDLGIGRFERQGRAGWTVKILTDGY